MAMHRRLQKEMPILRSKTLVQDGLAIEESSEKEPKPGQDVSFVALLAGPRDSPYEGGVFKLKISVSARYPLEPPKMHFQTRIFHPNVGQGHTPGAICLDILRKEAWSPALTLERTLLSIASLMADPNPASPMDAEAGRLFKKDRKAYDQKVREWVQKYAQNSGGSGSSSGTAWEGDFGKADDAEAEKSTAESPKAKAKSKAKAKAKSAAAAGSAGVINLDDDEEPTPKRARHT
eukprot:TRINITY_DN40619_c0_g1_i1.p1 TRINITY_DN40619_c0_g1~~TRINITY_DN40619_c0_g1_i1.p1  ORF type:complete len:275 (+),score=58.31 TRINITY_DN40619_c0_g1_i1:124-825(+)